MIDYIQYSKRDGQFASIVTSGIPIINKKIAASITTLAAIDLENYLLYPNSFSASFGEAEIGRAES